MFTLSLFLIANNYDTSNYLFMSLIIIGIISDGLTIIYYLLNIKRLSSLNKALEDKIQKLERTQKDLNSDFSFHVRMEILGTMLGHLAHLWRQPLSAITTAGTSIKLHQDLGTLDNQNLDSNIEAINNQAMKLSKTLDDFRIFFDPNEQKSVFLIHEPFNHVKDLLELEINNAKIELVIHMERLHIVGYKNIYMQIFMHLLQEQIKRLKRSSVKRRVIRIDFYREGHFNYLHIENNEGIVSERVISSLFMNTIYQRSLYITKELVSKNLFRGKLWARTSESTLEGTNYEGLAFVIKTSI